MIHFRQPHTEIALVVMAEVFGAICGRIPRSPLHDTVTSLGGSIDMAISGTTWTQMQPGKTEH